MKIGIIGVGPAQAQAVAEVASRYTTIRFATVDGALKGSVARVAELDQPTAALTSKNVDVFVSASLN